MSLKLGVIRAIALVMLLPAGLVCIGFPFYRLTLPGGWAIVDDTRAALGGGTDAGDLKAYYVDCTRQRSGSNSSRGIGLTEYDCVIDLSAAEATVAPTDGAWDGARSYEEVMAEHNRRISVALDAVVAQSRARSDVSNRIERTLATDRGGELPAVRILSAEDEPRRVGLVWGAGEIVFRWLVWLLTSVIFFAFGAACLFPVWLAWKRRPGG